MDSNRTNSVSKMSKVELPRIKLTIFWSDMLSTRPMRWSTPEERYPNITWKYNVKDAGLSEGKVNTRKKKNIWRENRLASLLHEFYMLKRNILSKCVVAGVKSIYITIMEAAKLYKVMHGMITELAEVDSPPLIEK